MVSGMPETSAAATPVEDLAAEIAARRAELGMTQADVAAAGGPSHQTLRNLEHAAVKSVNQKTLRRLDHALRWQNGYAAALLAGGEAAENARALRQIAAVAAPQASLMKAWPAVADHLVGPKTRAALNLAPAVMETATMPTTSDLATAAALVTRLTSRERTPTEEAVYSAARLWVSELMAAEQAEGPA